MILLQLQWYLCSRNNSTAVTNNWTEQILSTDRSRTTVKVVHPSRWLQHIPPTRQLQMISDSGTMNLLQQQAVVEGMAQHVYWVQTMRQLAEPRTVSYCCLKISTSISAIWTCQVMTVWMTGTLTICRCRTAVSLWTIRAMEHVTITRWSARAVVCTTTGRSCSCSSRYSPCSGTYL